VGVVCGHGVALAGAHVLARLVEGVRPTGVSTFAIPIAVLVVTALFASFIPARRASRVNPMKALRQD
jgi:ABC-type antimicrobial peptide transport system permease subunit